MNPAHRTAAERWLAIALGLVLLLAQAGEALHRAQVRHVRCAEHGELLHVSHVAPHVASSAATVPSQSEAPGPIVGPVPGAAEEHDHCVSVSPHRERWFVLFTETVRIVPKTPRDAAPRHGRPPAPAEIATYRLAPKHSPPCS